MKLPNRRGTGLWPRMAWALNDAGNSAFALVMVTAVFAIYFAKVVVGPDAAPGRSDMLWGLTISLSMILVAVTSPIMGALADRRGWSRRFLGIYTAIGALATAACAVVGAGDIALAMGLLVLANFAFEGSLVFNDGIMAAIIPAGARGRWSGIGWAIGYLGGMACLFLCMPWVDAGAFPTVFMVVGLWWVVFSLPILTLRGMPDTKALAPSDGLGPIKRLRKTLKRVWGNRDMRRFLVAFLLFNDGIATTIVFAGVYASTTLGFTDTEVLTLLLAVQLSAAIGAFGLGLLSDKLGLVRTIKGTLVAWIFLAIAAAFVTSATQFWGVALGIGLVLGATPSASRALLASMAPPGEATEIFGLKAVAGKVSAVIGPLMFGVISQATGSQRAAILSIALLFIAGLVLMRGVDEVRGQNGWPEE